MKIFTVKKKKIFKITIIILLVVIIFGVSKSFGMQHYYETDFTTGLVTATELNVRSKELKMGLKH